MAKRNEDLEFVQRILARDGDAWRELVVRFERLILARVLATARECGRELSDADADALVAEVFSTLLVRDMASLRQFEGRSTLSTWLTVVAGRIALRSMPRERSGPVDERPTARGEVSPTEELRVHPDPMDDSARRDLALLRMVYEEGLARGEVARRLGVSVDDIDSLLQLAHSRLRDHVGSNADHFDSKLSTVD